MVIDDIIRKRRSIFPAQFSGEKIPDHQILELLELANWAPNHLHTEPWRFRIYSGPATDRLMQEMAELYRSTTAPETYSEAKFEKYLHRAAKLSHAIAISVAYDEKARIPRLEEQHAVACAVQNFWLAISATPDIRGYWSTGNLVYTPEFHRILNLPDNEECMGIFYLGKLKADAVSPKSQRGPISDKVIWVRS
ncbi:MAG: nitroreductase [Flavobacteriales bacterium]|nr:nitroreductase [Flavobacteriales bacterium]